MQATVVQTRPGAAQGPGEETHPGAAQDSVVQTSPGEAQAQCVDRSECSTGIRSVDKSKSSTGYCCPDTSRCSSELRPLCCGVDFSRSSKGGLSSVGTSICISSPCGLDSPRRAAHAGYFVQTRPGAA